MALDTICIRSPYINDEIAKKIENQSFKRVGIDMESMNIHYELTVNDLEGSYDNRIKVQVKRKDYQFKSRMVTKKSKTPELVETPPYCEIEASVHKMLLGHNIFGGSEDFQKCVEYMIYTVENLLDVTLPFFEIWYVRRIDEANVFDLLDSSNVEDWFYYNRNAYFPRRNVNNYGKDGLYVAGSTSTVKFYHKGSEFKKNNMKKLIKNEIFTEEQAFDMYTKALRYLRVEVEIHIRKLKDDFRKIRYGNEPFVKDITKEYLDLVYESEVRKIIGDKMNEEDITRDAIEVKKRLYDIYSKRQAKTLYGAWLTMSQQGEDFYRMMHYTESDKRKGKISATFYKHKKFLKEAGVSWNTNKIIDDDDSILKKFLPFKNSKYRIIEEDENIKLKFNEMKEYKKAIAGDQTNNDSNKLII